MSQPATQQVLDASTRDSIFVCGEHYLTSEMICYYLNQTTGLPCSSGSLQDLMATANDCESKKPTVLLLDYEAAEVRERLFSEVAELLMKNSDILALVFNFKPDRKIKRLLSSGIRGVLYPSDHNQTMVKAIRAVIRGQMWIPRQAMTICLDELCDQQKAAPGPDLALTPREREILSCVASGKTNEEIATSLFISPFTVKVHIQNIFKKIGVPNRVKATIWAQNHLDL